MAIYEKTNSSNTLDIAQYQLYGSSRLGHLEAKFRSRNYEFSDHLGNVHLVLDDSREVQSATEYYPFGMPMQTLQLADGQRFGFNGQEVENELNASITSAEYWMYDGRLGRRWNLDPVVKEYESGYACLGNSPIWASDYNGADSSKSTFPPLKMTQAEVDERITNDDPLPKFSEVDGEIVYYDIMETVVLAKEPESYSDLLDLGPKPQEMDYEPKQGGVNSENAGSSFAFGLAFSGNGGLDFSGKGFTNKDAQPLIDMVLALASKDFKPKPKTIDPTSMKDAFTLYRKANSRGTYEYGDTKLNTTTDKSVQKEVTSKYTRLYYNQLPNGTFQARTARSNDPKDTLDMYNNGDTLWNDPNKHRGW